MCGDTLSKCRYVEGIICIGKLRNGYIFTYKYPERFNDNMLSGENVFIYVKDNDITRVSSMGDTDFYNECETLLSSVYQNECFIIKRI